MGKRINRIALTVKKGDRVLFGKYAGTRMKMNSIQLLPMEMAHCEHLTSLPFHHRDPFDRILISLAIVERMGMVSGDSRFSDYGIDRIW
ncbi:MAG: hypothetical protein AB1512_26555 [Thermodesulfobacteriota bacterium]